MGVGRSTAKVDPYLLGGQTMSKLIILCTPWRTSYWKFPCHFLQQILRILYILFLLLKIVVPELQPPQAMVCNLMPGFLNAVLPESRVELHSTGDSINGDLPPVVFEEAHQTPNTDTTAVFEVLLGIEMAVAFFVPPRATLLPEVRFAVRITFDYGAFATLFIV